MINKKLLKDPLFEEQIVEWMVIFYNKYKKYPSGEEDICIPEMGNNTWKCINSALKKGTRGLKGGLSLDILKEKSFGIRSKHNKRLSDEILINIMKEFENIYGRLPTRKDKHVPGYLDDKWIAIESALMKGSRGFSGGSSIIRFKEKIFWIKK